MQKAMKKSQLKFLSVNSFIIHKIVLFLSLINSIRCIYMKTILCYGDSITWGYNPETGARYEYDKTWPRVLQKTLGAGYRVVTEGLCGRTTCWDLPALPYRNGKNDLPMIMESQMPVSLIIIMLGTNDMITALFKTADDSAFGILSLVRIVLASSMEAPPPKIMIISPPVIGKLSEFMDMSYHGKEEESKKLAHCYKIIAEQTKSAFMDSNDYIKVSDVDGLHPLEDQHQILGEAVAKKIKEMSI